MKVVAILLLLSACLACGICASTNRNAVDEAENLIAQQQPDPEKDPENPCFLAPSSGMCLAGFHRFFYNAATGTCQGFIYGGCGGNGNRFESEEECMVACGDTTTSTNPNAVDKGETLIAQQQPDPEKDRENPCFLAPESGMCLADFPSFFYNAATGTCQRFIYGGCQGNGNRFESEEECMVACGETTISANRNAVGKGKTLIAQQQPDPEKDPENPCFLAPESGICLADFPSFFYNATTGTCQGFIYGGCQGNGNRFESEKQCMVACGETKTSTNRNAVDGTLASWPPLVAFSMLYFLVSSTMLQPAFAWVLSTEAVEETGTGSEAKKNAWWPVEKAQSERRHVL